MNNLHLNNSFYDQLPSITVKHYQNYPLSKITWFKVGGPAEVLCLPSNIVELKMILSIVPKEFQINVIGVCSNLLIRDGGVSGVVIKLGHDFKSIRREGNEFVVGGAALGVIVARLAAKSGISGLEFLSGIPGTIGGAVAMNAGAFGSEISDVFVSCEVIDRFGNFFIFSKNDLNFSYRYSSLLEKYILLNVRLKGAFGNKGHIESKIQRIKSEREKVQPIRKRTGGSTFKNPSSSKRAWELIDIAGCRGLVRGGAIVSTLHCNFLINTGFATATDIEGLGEDVKMRVFNRTGTELEWEIKRIGSNLGEVM